MALYPNKKKMKLDHKLNCNLFQICGSGISGNTNSTLRNVISHNGFVVASNIGLYYIFKYERTIGLNIHPKIR